MHVNSVNLNFSGSKCPDIRTQMHTSTLTNIYDNDVDDDGQNKIRASSSSAQVRSMPICMNYFSEFTSRPTNKK